jgi:hypothetical protein
MTRPSRTKPPPPAQPSPSAIVPGRPVRYFIRMGTCPDTIKRLIDRYTHQSDQLRSPDYNEARIGIDFISPLMSSLGLDVDNCQAAAVVEEASR